MPFEKSAGAVIFRTEGQKPLFLLLHYPSSAKAAKDYWDLPKGHIEKGENEIDTVKREVGEETGLKDLKFVEGFREWIKYFFISAVEPPKELARRDTPSRLKSGRDSSIFERKKIFKIVTFYLAEVKNQDVKISSEHIGYDWLVYEEAIKRLTFKNAKEVLKKANHFLEKKENEAENKFSE